MPTDWLATEEERLAPYAMRSRLSRGRRFPEGPHEYRTPFQRDRERVVHSTGFRRLVGKTQVLVGRINDHHRTRLTHTLEVSQIGRTVARRLRLNEDLVEAIALSHDLGHPPFGHAGEAALDELLRDQGGFDHNLQGLRQVDEREDRYPETPGLNLTWEVREAFARHTKRPDSLTARPFLQDGAPLLEAQLVDAADGLAYDVHDVDDALGIGLITLDDLEGVEFWARAAEAVRSAHPGLAGNRFRTAVLRELIGWQVRELLAGTERLIGEGNIRDLDAVRAAARPLVDFPEPLRRLKRGLEQFLLERVYRHHQVLRMAQKGQRVLKALFDEFVRKPSLLPGRHLRRWSGAPRWLREDRRGPPWDADRRDSLERTVGDYLAGMTDRYARKEYQRLFQPSDDL